MTKFVEGLRLRPRTSLKPALRPGAGRGTLKCIVGALECRPDCLRQRGSIECSHGNALHSSSGDTTPYYLLTVCQVHIVTLQMIEPRRFTLLHTPARTL